MDDTPTSLTLPGLPEPAAPAHATLIGTDGRTLTLAVEAGGLAITVGVARPLLLDRWQALALAAAVAELPR